MSAFDSYQCVCECKTARKIFSLVFVILFIPTMNVSCVWVSYPECVSMEAFENVLWAYNSVHEHPEHSTMFLRCCSQNKIETLEKWLIKNEFLGKEVTQFSSVVFFFDSHRKIFVENRFSSSTLFYEENCMEWKWKYLRLCQFSMQDVTSCQL
jgi:hypothetical protein